MSRNTGGDDRQNQSYSKRVLFAQRRESSGGLIDSVVNENTPFADITRQTTFTSVGEEGMCVRLVLIWYLRKEFSIVPSIGFSFIFQSWFERSQSVVSLVPVKVKNLTGTKSNRFFTAVAIGDNDELITVAYNKI
jgi:hypothetical protein